MNHEGIPNNQDNIEFRQQIEKMLERYGSIYDKMIEYGMNSDSGKILREEQNRQADLIVQAVIAKLKHTENKQQILDDLSKAFFEQSIIRSPELHENSDEPTDSGTHIIFLEKIVLALSS